MDDNTMATLLAVMSIALSGYVLWLHYKLDQVEAEASEHVVFFVKVINGLAEGKLEAYIIGDTAYVKPVEELDEQGTD